MIDADDLIASYEAKRDEAREHVRDAAEFLHENEGTFYPRSELRDRFAEDFQVDQEVANQIITELVADRVDPVQQVDGHVGVIEYHEGDHHYRYVAYDDVRGKEKAAVCMACVDEAVTDHEAVHFQEGFGSTPRGITWNDLINKLKNHVNEHHPNVDAGDISTGATLLSGTTIGGNTVLHNGNEHDNNQHSDDFVLSSTEGQLDIQKDGTDGAGVINFKTA